MLLCNIIMLLSIYYNISLFNTVTTEHSRHVK